MMLWFQKNMILACLGHLNIQWDWPRCPNPWHALHLPCWVFNVWTRQVWDNQCLTAVLWRIPCVFHFSRERLRRVLRKKAAVILHLHTFTSADDLHTLTPADLDLHTFTPADLDLHTFTPADLDLHTFTSADLLSLFFYSLLRRGRCRRSATKRNPFARNGRWTSKT